MDRREMLEYTWSVAWSDLVKQGLTFSRILNKSWLDEKRYSDVEAKDELMKKGKLCFDNLKSLRTEIGKQVYVKHLSMQAACYADNHNEEYMESQKAETNITASKSWFEKFKKLKIKYPDKLLIFSVGEYYRAYLKDADEVARVLNITLSQENDITDEEGIPVTTATLTKEAFERGLPQLIRAGNNVDVLNDFCEVEENEQSTEQEEIYERTFFVSCTKQQLVDLGNYMYDNGMHFEKIANGKIQSISVLGDDFDICKTDARNLIKFLESFKEINEAKYEEDKKPIYINHARAIGKLIGKLQSKIKD